MKVVLESQMKKRSANAAMIAAATLMFGAVAIAAPAQKTPPAAPRAPRTEAAPKPAAAPAPAPRVAQTWTAEGFPGSGSYLGVDIAEITAERQAALKLSEERGVEIVTVDQDAPAGKAGLKEHDVILEFNGSRVEGEEQLRRFIRETPPGRAVKLGISRDGQPMQVSVTLGDRRKAMKQNKFVFVNPKIPPMPPMPDIDMPSFDYVIRTSYVSAGMMVDNLTPQLGEFFGVKGGEGVLVRSVEKGGAAEAAGIKAGDVIVKADTEKIGDRSDWRQAIRNRKGGKLPLTIVRDKREQVLTITLPEKKEKDESSLQEFDGPETGNMDFDIDLDFDEIEDMAHGAQFNKFSMLSPTMIAAQIESVRPTLEKLKNSDFNIQINQQIDDALKQLESQHLLGKGDLI